MNVLAFVPYRYNTAPGQRFRIEQWARLLEPEGVRFRFVPFETDRLAAILHARGHLLAKFRELLRGIIGRMREVASVRDGWNALFLHRELLPVFFPFLERIVAGKGLPLIYDFDDAVFLPDTSEANRWFRWLKAPQKTGVLCRMSAHVVVGNAYLARYALRHNPNVTLIPTTIDTEQYLPKGSVELPPVPVVGWSGSQTTLKHLRTIESALRALARRVPCRLRVIGVEGYTLAGVQVEARAWDPRTEVEDLRSFDVGLMPLPDDPWARGKCGLKALQYMAVGVPAVVSPIGVNGEIIQDAENGFWARNEREWVERIARLLADRDLRARFSREGRRTVESRYSARVHAPRLLEVLRQVGRRCG